MLAHLCVVVVDQRVPPQILKVMSVHAVLGVVLDKNKGAVLSFIFKKQKIVVNKIIVKQVNLDLLLVVGKRAVVDVLALLLTEQHVLTESPFVI